MPAEPAMATSNPMVQLKSLQAKLQAEREDRKKTEEQACKLLKQYKQKYDASLQEKSSLIDELKNEVETERQRNRSLEDKNRDIKEELKELKESLRKSEEQAAKRSRSKSPHGTASSRERSSSKKRYDGILSSMAANGVTDDLVKEVERLTEELKCLQATMEAKDAEVARSKERAQFSREINIELRGEKADLQKEVTELKTKLESAEKDVEERIKSETESIKKSKREIEKKLKEEERTRDKLMEDIKSLKKIISRKDTENEKNLSEISDLKKVVENYRKEKEREIEKEKSNLLKELKELKSNLDKKSTDLKKQTQMADVMKKTCEEIEKQAEEFDHLLSKKSSEYDKILSNLRKVESERDGLKRELKNVHDSLNDGTKRTDSVTKKLMEQITRLESSIRDYQDTVARLESEVVEERQIASDHVERARQLERELDETTMVGTEYMNRVSDLEEVVREVKEEAARHVTVYLEEKAKTNRLKRDLAAAQEKIDVLQAKIESLKHKMEREKVANDTEVFRLQERLRQHHQAEKEMMARIEKLEQKKKPWVGINSPLPRKGGPRSAPPVQLGGTKDAESQLQVEREANRRLQQQLIRTETELLDLKMEMKLTRVNHFDEANSDSPSAPPPPYGNQNHNADNASHSPSTNSSAPSTCSSDNNLPTMDDTDYLDVDRVVNGRPGWRVRADVHQPVEEEDEDDDDDFNANSHRPGEFTFTESALNLITENHNTTSPLKRMNH